MVNRVSCLEDIHVESPYIEVNGFQVENLMAIHAEKLCLEVNS